MGTDSTDRLIRRALGTRLLQLCLMLVRTDSLHAVVCISFVLCAATTSQQRRSEHVWDYGQEQGPSHWGELEAEFASCKAGHRQSPIDIRHPRKAALPAIEFDYKPSPLHIIDNGHTVLINYTPGSFITVVGKRYALKQFHFHRPSEEKIKGRSFAMSVHLVHADEGGNTAVVAVVLKNGTENPLLQTLLDDVPREKEHEEMFDSVRINAAGLLPGDRGYYTYSGSLTTPPCTENVTWFVLKQPVTVSASEIKQFSRLYRHDARPVQPVYDRTVLESR